MLVAIYSSRLTENERKKCQKNTLLEKDLLDGFLIPSYTHILSKRISKIDPSRIDKILLLYLATSSYLTKIIPLIFTSFISNWFYIYIFSKFFEEKYKYLEKRINSLETSFYENRIREIKTSNARSTSISTSIALIRAGYRNGEKERRGKTLRAARWKHGKNRRVWAEIPGISVATTLF